MTTWILVTWIITAKGAPQYQRSTPVASQAACEALYKEISNTPGAKLAGHLCTEKASK